MGERNRGYAISNVAIQYFLNKHRDQLANHINQRRLQLKLNEIETDNNYTLDRDSNKIKS